MEDQLENNITHIGFWLEESWNMVEKVKDEEYQQEAVHLLVIAAAFFTVLQDFHNELDEPCIDFCIYTILNILSLIRAQVKLFKRAGFTSLDAILKQKTLSLMINIRHQSIADFKALIEKYGLSGLY